MTKMDDVQNVGFSLLDPQEGHNTDSFDFTKLTAVNTCPTWGIIRYGMHKAMPKTYEGSRSMALEIGKVAHDAFAAIRLAQVWHTLPEHAQHHAVRVLGKSRGEQVLAVIRKADTVERAIRHAALEAVTSSGFEDDPYDKRRTLANLESSVSAYASSYDYDRWPVWVADRRDPRAAIGVEMPFNMLLTVLTKDDRTYSIRMTGKIDGIHWHRTEGGEVIIHENKTGGRLDDTWSKGFDVSHQVTGYTVAGMLLTGEAIKRTVVRGVQLPLPKMIINGLVDKWVVRDKEHQSRWVAWVLHTYALYNEYRDRPLEAPLYTHSCTRYFRPCPFIPLCTSDDKEREQILYSEMVTDEWSPLAEEYDA